MLPRNPNAGEQMGRNGKEKNPNLMRVNKWEEMVKRKP
jgi:hypothetical protein